MTMISLHLTILALFSLVHPATAQNSWYCGAAPLQAATPAQCPSWAQISCSSIGATGYCCPSGTYCGWANGQVGCCTNGLYCSGQIAGAGGQWQPTPTTTTTTTIYSQAPLPTPCVVCAGQVSTVYVQPSTVTLQPSPSSAKQITTVAAEFCSTQTAHGPGLPTTARAGCGTMLIVAGAPRVSLKSSLSALAIAAVFVLSALLWL